MILAVSRHSESGRYLCGEADVFESLILTPAAEDVGEGGEGVLVHGGGMSGLLEQDAPQSGHRQCQDPVHKHQKLRVSEALPATLRLRVTI